MSFASGGTWILRAVLIGVLAYAIFGPLANLLIWSFAEAWFWPNKLPSQWGFRFWEYVFRPTGRAMEALWLSLMIAMLTVALSLAVAVPAGYALARGKLPWRSLIMLAFLLPQAFPSLPVYINIARIFYQFDLNGTVLGVVLVHASHGLVFAVWIATAAFASIDRELEQAARNLGASGMRTFMTVTLPLAMPGLIASAIFVFLESLDEFTGSFFVGAPEIRTLPLEMFNASMGGNYQISSITALILLVPSIGFMLVVERFLKGEVLAKVGA
jgi:ABC-type spermidine/putrescine transport system permease subunit II